MHCWVLVEGILTWPEIQIKCIIQPNALTCKDKHESQCYKTNLQKKRKIVEMKDLEMTLSLCLLSLSQKLKEPSDPAVAKV